MERVRAPSGGLRTGVRGSQRRCQHDRDLARGGVHGGREAIRRVAKPARIDGRVQQLAQLATALTGDEPDGPPQRGRRRTVHQPADQQCVLPDMPRDVVADRAHHPAPATDVAKDQPSVQALRRRRAADAVAPPRSCGLHRARRPADRRAPRMLERPCLNPPADGLVLLRHPLGVIERVRAATLGLAPAPARTRPVSKPCAHHSHDTASCGLNERRRRRRKREPGTRASERQGKVRPPLANRKRRYTHVTEIASALQTPPRVASHWSACAR